MERLGGIDVCIANAGIAAGGPLRHSDLGNYERVIEVNLLGVIRTVNACLPHVLERGGYLLPIASVAAALHAPAWARTRPARPASRPSPTRSAGR